LKFEGGDGEKNEQTPVDAGDIELEEVKADTGHNRQQSTDKVYNVDPS
tara:strand:+ start:78 stop:221 length:144 start_codon:yes stop_codon:yes gene_type:complete